MKSLRRGQLFLVGILALICFHTGRGFVSSNYDEANKTSKEIVTIASLMDTGRFNWTELVIRFTVGLINNHSDGWNDDVLPDAFLEYSLDNSSCDEDIAVRAYLNLTRGRRPPHAISGCRCSGPTMAIARLCAVEDIPIVSATATSVKLSNKNEYSTFSRLAAPDDQTGQVGGLVLLLKSFGWRRITIINTDTQYTKDIALELSSAWKQKHVADDGTEFEGEVVYTDTIKLIDTKTVSDFSVKQVLNGIPVNDPKRNSRVIVMFAHHQHAFPILKIAHEIGFQPDTIWIGVSGWIGRNPIDGDISWMPAHPGYLGLSPYRNMGSDVFKDYLRRLQEFQRREGLPVTYDMYGPEADQFADSILLLAKALTAVGPEQRRNGELVVDTIRNISFEGLMGQVSFTPSGDLANPQYSVLTKPSHNVSWLNIGHVDVKNAKINVDYKQMCYAQIGCTSNIPSDRYPMPKERLQWWIWFVIGVLGLVCFLFVRQKVKTRSVKEKLRQIEAELQDIDHSDDARRQKKALLYQKIADLLQHPAPEHWTDESGLVKVPSTTQEYWDVLDKLRESMSDNVRHPRLRLLHVATH